jgi:2',3'-cyclic-nucleotide 2'-phosphodiesterase (5'-nucleotidase family)
MRNGHRIRQGLLALGLAWAGATEARQVEITILHTTDLHGRLLPTTDYDGRTGVGGLLRCATLIERIRAERPHVLLVDCGDLYQGSTESYLSDGRPMVRALGWLRYDAWVLGNHEFDWGLPKLQALHAQAEVPMLAANMTSRPGRPPILSNLRPYVVREMDGVKVAIVGLITPGVPSWSTPDLLGDALFDRSVTALQRILPQVRAESPDVIVLATHQGYKSFGDDHANEVNAIAGNFPEIDAIIGGHTHQAVEQARVGRGTLFTQAGYYGAWLGDLVLTYDTVTRDVVQVRSRLHTVDAEVPMHEGLRALVHEDLERAAAYLARKVGEAREPIPYALDAYGNSPVQALLCRAMAEASGAEIVLHGILDEAALPAGDITMEHIWRVVPYENRVATMLLTAEEIQVLLEENARLRSGIQFMGAWGLRYDWGKDGRGSARVENLRLADGSHLHPRQRFRVAVNSYVVASGGRRFPRLREIAERPESRLQLLDVDTRTAVANFVKAHSPLTVQGLTGGTVP